MLLLHLLSRKELDTGASIKRTRISELTLTKLWARSRISADFLSEVQEWILAAGWTLFFAGSTYALARVDVVEAWGSLASKRLGDTVESIRRGAFDFDSIEGVFFRWTDSADEGDEGGDQADAE